MHRVHGRIDDGIAYLDNGLLNAAGVGTTYVVRGDEIAIVETGSSLCAATILEGLAALGVRPREVRHILLTHVHLDHAGGAGVLVDAMPDARVYIHSLTAQHLVDPSRLLPSAERALGELFPLHGTIVPLAAEKLVPAEDLRLDLGRGMILSALATPGHSPDHIAYYHEGSGALFAGDSLGIVLPAFDYLGPVTPPPALDIPAQHATFQKLLDLPISRLLFSHWGPSPLPAHAVIGRLRASFERFDSLVQAAMERPAIDEAEIVKAMLPAAPIPAPGEDIIVGWVRMSIKGMVRYYTKLREQQAEPRP